MCLSFTYTTLVKITVQIATVIRLTQRSSEKSKPICTGMYLWLRYIHFHNVSPILTFNEYGNESKISHSAAWWTFIMNLELLANF